MLIRTGEHVARVAAIINVERFTAVFASHRTVAPRVTITVLTTYDTSFYYSPSVLGQLLLKRISITKYKLLSKKESVSNTFLNTLPMNAEIQNTRYFCEVIKLQITFNCEQTTCRMFKP